LKVNFESLPNYVCQETVERSQVPPGRGRPQKLDSLHFEVAHVQNKELLALPGASGFEDLDVSYFNPAGLLGSGTFSSLPRNLFIADHARITRHFEDVLPPAIGVGFDYVIPDFLSGFELSTVGASATVGQRGTFWLDPDSLDLMRIEDHAVDVPLRIGMSAADTTVSYARMRIGSSEVLLPQSAVVVVTELSGKQMRNDITYSGCREYVSESKIRFGDPGKN
jgi:hypothetical protein